MMPKETESAIKWALEKDGVTKETRHDLVHYVRDYFNENNVEYISFSYEDLKAYL